MYATKKRDFAAVPQFSLRDVAYQKGEPALRPFYEHLPEWDSFQAVIEQRKGFDVDRKVLVEALKSQYAGLDTPTKVSENIESLLAENTFTVVTAHQPVLLTGPLYFIYKIAGAIHASQKLNASLPDINIVPVFILGGEDHDFDEIASCRIFNKTFTWESPQKGAVGRMKIEDLSPVLEEIIGRFGQSQYAEELERIIRRAYEASETYGQFTFHLVNDLFGNHGLVVLNTDNRHLKESFLPYVIRDLRESISHRTVNKDQKGLEKCGFKAQAYAREVNLFFHDEERHRVMFSEQNNYLIGDKELSLEDLIGLIKANPGEVSPNVVLRPLYQEVILPNLAYIGGGGELAYWMERKSMFKAFDVPFPMLIRRNSFIIVDKRSMQTLDQLNLPLEDLFDREEQIINQYALQQANTEINLDVPKERVREIFQEIADLSKDVDPTLYKSVLGECSKVEKIIEYLENKLLKAEKRKRSTELKKISNLKSKFFPNNDGLQERYDNFIPFYLRYGSDWINAIISEADPLDKAFKILIEQDVQSK